MKFKYILSTLTIAAGSYIYATGASSAPDLMQSVQRLFHSVAGYSSTTCKADSVGCLQSREAALNRSRGEIESAIGALRSEVAKVGAIAEDNATMLAKTSAFLDQGKAILKAGQATGAAQFIFAGRNYDAASLRVQLETLFAERTMLETQVRDSRALQAKLDARLQDLRIEQGKVAAAIAILPSQLTLLQANASEAAFEHSLGLIDMAVQTSDDGVKQANDLIGTTADLEKRNQDASGLTPRQQQISEDFDKFMTQ